MPRATASKVTVAAVVRESQRGVKHTHYVIVPGLAHDSRGKPAYRNAKRAARPAGMSGRQWVRFRKAQRRAA